MRLYLFRHGPTKLADKRIIQGRMDVPLDEDKIDYVRKKLRPHQETNFDAIFSSPLRRASRTAEVLTERTRQRIVIDHNIIERGHGELEGQYYEKVRHIMERDEYLPRGAESLQAVASRLRRFIKIRFSSPYTQVAAVTHAGTFGFLIRDLFNIDRNASEAFRMAPCEHYILEKKQDRFLLLDQNGETLLRREL